MSILDVNLDAMIEAEKAKLQELIDAREAQQKKRQDLQVLNRQYENELNSRQISESDYFEYISDKLENWIKSNEASQLNARLARHFEKRANSTKIEQPAKTSSLVIRPLKTGKYRNPATQEVVEKIRRNPKKLDQWVEEYGLAIVRKWII